MSVIQGAVYQATYVGPADLSGSNVVLTVTAPDSTTSTPAVTTVGSGASATVPATVVGAYLLVWSVTGVVVDSVMDQFTCVKASLGLISLSDLKDQINYSGTDYSQDAKLRRFIQTATDVVENITGPILPKTETYVIDGGGTFFVIPRRWVSSITSVVETIGVVNYALTEQPLGFSVNNYGYTWDRSIQKVVRRGGAGAAIPFAGGSDNVSCVYVAGLSTIPQDITDAAGELIRHWWVNGQEPFRGAFQAQPGDDTGTITIMGYAVPNRVVEMLLPYRRSDGIF